MSEGYRDPWPPLYALLLANILYASVESARYSFDFPATLFLWFGIYAGMLGGGIMFAVAMWPRVVDFFEGGLLSTETT
ncbi:hypothetical protein [Haloarchaeobius sp. DFWS5]|uniref:hypothetical protein n=1 Tax=Haloarchaeobius sp. DFWS5 TaxID=3446114 RepID=UPI003EBC8A50